MANKPSITFDVWPEGRSNGRFVGRWASPGLVAGYAFGEDGQPAEFETEAEAKLAAMNSMFTALNRPREKANEQQGKPEKCRLMTGPEFASLLRSTGLTPTAFARIYNTTQNRTLKWIDGGEVPHPVRVLLNLFLDNIENITVAREVTAEVEIKR